MWQFNAVTGKWEFVENPTFKKKSQASNYQNSIDQNILDNIKRDIGAGPSSLERVATSTGREAAFDQNYPNENYEDYFDNEQYTPGGLQGKDPFTLEGDQAKLYKDATESLGYAPGVKADHMDLMAENQSVLDKWANGITKFVGKTATNVVGSTVGQVYGLFSAIGNGEFNKFYDNAFQRVLDDANTAMDEALPNYVTNEEKERSLFGQMGTANFWANDFLGGMSFVAGAVLSELATKGMSTPALIARATKLLKLGRVAKAADVATDAAGKGFKAFNVGQDFIQPSLDFARKTIVGAGYEAGVEARHFVDEAKTNYINSYTEQNGRPPSEVEVASFMDEAHRVGNTVFGINLALVGGANAVTLPKSFGPGLLDRMGKMGETVGLKSGVDDAAKGVVKTSELSTKQLERIAAKTGQSVDEILKTPTINKALAYSTGEKIGRNTFNALKKPFVEGVWEEGMQGSINKGALDYVARTYDEDATNDTMNMGEALLQGMEETYGSSEGWKEIMVGMLIGSTGMVSPGKGGKGLGWQGNIFQELVKNDAKDARVNGLVNMINANPSMIPVLSNNWKAAKQQLVASRNTDKALEENDFLNAKNEQFKAFHSYVAAKVEAGMYDDIIDNDIAEIQKMPEDKFAEEFGYENLTSEELKERKQKVINSVKEQAKNTRDALNHAKRITKSDDWDLNHGLAYTIASIKNADKREGEMAKSFSEALGSIYSQDQIKNLVTLNFNTKDNKQLITQLSTKRKELAELNRKIIESTPKGGGNLAVESNLIKRENQRDELEREISTIEKELYRTAQAVQNTKGEKLPYTRDFDAFLQDLEIFEQVQNDLKNLEINVGQGYGPAMNPKDLLKDLTRLARQRQQTILEYNLFMTEEGQKDFIASIDNLNKLILKDRLTQEQMSASKAMLAGAMQKGATLKDMQTLAFKAKLNEVVPSSILENSPVENETKTIIDAANSVIKSLPNPTATSTLAKSFINEYIALKDNEPRRDLNEINALIKKLKDLKDRVARERALLEDDSPAAIELDKFEAEGHIDILIDLLTQEATKLSNQPSTNVNYDSPVSGVGKIVNIYVPKGSPQETIDLVESLDYKDIPDLSLEIQDYPKAGTIKDSATEAGVPIKDSPVKITTGVTGVGDKKVTIAVKYKGTVIGFLLDPQRYVIQDTDGTTRPPKFVEGKESLEDLKLFNTTFVYSQKMPDGSTKEFITDSGEKFLNAYQKTTVLWNSKIRPNIKDGKPLDKDIMEWFKPYITYKNKFNDDKISTVDYFESKGLKLSDDIGPVVYDRTSLKWYEYKNGEFVEIENRDKVKEIKGLIGENGLKKAELFKNQLIAAFHKDDNQIKAIPLRFSDLADADSVISTISTLFEEQAKLFKVATVESEIERKNIIPEDKGFVSINKEDKETKATYVDFYVSGKKAGSNTSSARITLSLNNSGLNAKEFFNFNYTTKKISGYIIPHLQVISSTFENGKWVEKPVGSEMPFKTNKELIDILNKSISFRVNKITKDIDYAKANNSSWLGSKIAEKDLLTNNGEPIKITGFKNAVKQENISEGLKNTTPGYTLAAKIALFPNQDKTGIASHSHLKPVFTPKAQPTTPVSNKKADDLKRGDIITFQLEEYQVERITENSIDVRSTKTGDTDIISKEDYNLELDALKTNSGTSTTIPTFNIADFKGMTDSNMDSYKDKLDKLTLDQIQELSDSYTGKQNRSLRGSILAFGKEKFKNNTNGVNKLKDGSREEVTYSQAVRNLKRMLPSDISVEELEKVEGYLVKAGIAWGTFFNKTIYLAKKVGKGTEYHEAFHAVFRALMSPVERIATLGEARNRYNPPTKRDIAKLKINHPELSAKELDDLYYEEQLSDEFQDFANKKTEKPKGIIARLWDRITKFINWIKGNKADIDLLFESIYQGDFKSRTASKYINLESNAPVYKLIEKASFGYFDTRISNNVISKLSSYLVNAKNEKGYFTKEDYASALETLTDAYDVYDSEESHYLGKGLSDYQLDRIDELFQALLMEAKTYSLFEEVSNKANRFSIGAIDNREEEDETGDPTEEEYPTEFSVKDASDLIGYDSLSRKMKEYLNYIEIPYDPFGFLDADDLGPEFNNYLDGQELYYAIEGRLTDTLEHNMLPKLLSLAGTNPKIASFTTKLIKDINKELSDKYPSWTPIENWEDLLDDQNYDYDLLAESNSFNLFISAFKNVTVQAITNLSDNNQGIRKVIRSNSQDVQDKQFTKWFLNYQKVKGLYNVDTVVEDVIDSLYSGRSLTQEGFAENIRSIQDSMAKLGIDLAYDYIGYSIISNLKSSSNEELSLDYALSLNPDSEFLNKLNKTYSLFSSVYPITDKDLLGIKFSLTTGNKNYDLLETDEDSKEKLGIVEGARGRLTKLAFANTKFSEDAGNSTYTNSRNKTKTSVVKPSYFDIQAMLFSDPERWSWNDNSSDSLDSFQTLKNILIKQKEFSNFDDSIVQVIDGKLVITLEDADGVAYSSKDLNSAYNLLKYYYANIDNPLLKGMNSSGASSALYKEVIFRDFRNYNSEGTMSVSLKEAEDGLYTESYKGKEGETFMRLDKRGKYNTMLSYFIHGERKNEGGENKGEGSVNAFEQITTIRDADGKDKTITKVPFILIQTETKQTQTVQIMPVNNLTIDGELNSLGVSMITGLLKQEYDRISRVTKEIEDPNNKFVIEDYHNGNLRGQKFFNFAYLKDTNPQLYTLLETSAIKGIPFNNILAENEEQIEELIKESLAKKYDEFIQDLLEEGMISEKDGVYVNNLLPSYYVNQKTFELQNLDHFFYNEYVNSVSYNNLLFGDMAANFKNPVDLVKRMAGANSSGPGLGNSDTNIAAIDDEYIDDDFTEDKNKDKINNSDAQSYGTSKWFKKYLLALGKKGKKVSEIYKKIDRGYKLTVDEIKFLENNAALANPKKTTTFTQFIYGKTSTKILIRNEVSWVDSSNRKRLDSLYDRLDNEMPNSVEYNDIIKEIHSLWRPRPGREKLHNLYNKMEAESVDIVFRKSAIKTQKLNINSDLDVPFNTQNVSDKYIKEQLVTDNMSKNVIHGVQLIQLITGEHTDLNATVTLNGEKVKIGDIVNFYDKLIGLRVTESYINLRKTIMDGDTPKFNILLDFMKESIMKSGGDPTLLELFQKDTNNDPKYSLNLPRVLTKFENMFNAYINNGALKHKVAGTKYTLVSSYGYEVLRGSNEEIITQKEFDASPSKFMNGDNTLMDGYTTSRLKMIKNDDGSYDAECMISAKTALELGLKVGEIIPERLKKLLGFRIPTDDKHSMIRLKVVDILPGETGNQIILPAEAIKLSGADFDIDSEFTRWLATYDNIEIYGDYINKTTSEERYTTAYKEFRNEALESEEVSHLIKVLKNGTSEEAKSLRENSIKILEANKLIADKIDSKIPKDIEYVKTAKEFVKQLNTTNKTLLTKIANMSLLTLNYPTSTEEFLAHRNNDGKAYKDIIDNNYKLNSEGKYNQITPITIYEIDNILFEIERELISNSKNDAIFRDPISFDMPDSFKNEYYKAKEGELPLIPDTKKLNEVNTPTSIVTASNNGAVGQDNVGIAALWNTAFNWITRHQLSLRVPLDFLGETLFKFNSYLTENGERINKNSNTQINMATDEANRNDARYFNLNTTTLPSSLLMSGFKKSFNNTSAFHIQPAIIEVAKAYSIVDSPIKAQDEKYKSKRGMLEDIKQKYKLTEEELKQVSPRILAIEGIPSESILKEALQFNYYNDTSKLTAIDYKYIQNLVLSQFEDISNLSQFIKEFATVSGLLKGNKPTWSETELAVTALEKLGFKIVKQKNTSGFKPQHYVLEKAKDFSDEYKYPIDFSPVLNNEAFKGLIGTLGVVLNDSKSFFITQTTDAKNLMKKVKPSFKESRGRNKLDYKEGAESLKKQIIMFYGLQAYKKLKNKEFSFDDIFSFSKETPTRLLTLWNKLGADPKYLNNEFINFVSPGVTDYRAKPGHQFQGRVLHKLKADSRGRKSPDYQSKLQDGFFQLANSNDPEAKEFAELAYAYLLVKDGGSFTNDSFVAQISPITFIKYSEALNKALDALNGKSTYKEAFGVNKDQLEDEFIELFSRNATNTFMLKSSKITDLFTKSKSFKDAYKAEGLLDENEQPKINPIQFDSEKGTLKFDIFVNSKEVNNYEGIEIEDVYATRKLGKPKINSSVRVENLKAIINSGLVTTHRIENNGNPFTVLGFPKFMYVTTGSGKTKRTKLYRRIDKGVPKNANPEINKLTKEAYNDLNVVIDNKAEYEEVDILGSKEVTTYAYTTKQWENFIDEGYSVFEANKKDKKEVEVDEGEIGDDEPLSPPVVKTEVKTEVKDNTNSKPVSELVKIGLLAVKRVQEAPNLSAEEKEKLSTFYTGDQALVFVNFSLKHVGFKEITHQEINGAKVIDGKLC